jgi:hypothetical protein
MKTSEPGDVGSDCKANEILLSNMGLLGVLSIAVSAFIGMKSKSSFSVICLPSLYTCYS